MDKKSKIILTLITVVIFISGIFLFSNKLNKKENKGQEIGDVVVEEKTKKQNVVETKQLENNKDKPLINNDKKETKKVKTEDENKSEEIIEENSLDDLKPLKYYNEKEEFLNKLPYIYNKDKKFYAQFNVMLLDNVYRGALLGQVSKKVEDTEKELKEGYSNRLPEGTEFVQNIFSDNIIMIQNHFLSCYDVFTSKPLYYSKLDNIIKNKTDIQYMGIYTNLYNNYNDIPTPDMLPYDFISDLKEIPYNIKKYNESFGEDIVDSLMYFEMGDGLSYGYRCWYDPKVEKVFFLDEINKKQYELVAGKDEEKVLQFLSLEQLRNN